MSASQTLAITENLTIYNALDQKQRMLNALGATQDLELELSQVAEMDTAGLQLLIMLKREAQRTGKCVRIVAHSQAVSSLIDFCHMATYFGDPVVITAQERG